MLTKTFSEGNGFLKAYVKLNKFFEAEESVVRWRHSFCAMRKINPRWNFSSQHSSSISSFTFFLFLFSLLSSFLSLSFSLLSCLSFFLGFLILVADTQLCMRLCPAVRPSVGSGHRVEKWGNRRFTFRYYLCMFECWLWVGLWMGVGCPCPPVRNDIVTPCHLFLFLFPFSLHVLLFLLFLRTALAMAFCCSGRTSSVIHRFPLRFSFKIFWMCLNPFDG